MSATKEHYHDLIEQGTRMLTGQELRQMEYLHNRDREAKKCPKYDILHLSALNMAELILIATAIGLVVGDASNRQNLMYAILNKQAESWTK